MMEASTPVSPEKKKGPDEYEIKCWADRIIEAHDIMNDPEKMKHVGPELEKREMALHAAKSMMMPAKPEGKLAALKSKANKMEGDY